MRYAPRLPGLGALHTQEAAVADKPKSSSNLLKTEDYWAIWLGLLVIFVAVGAFYAGGTLKDVAVTPGKWDTFDKLVAGFAKNWLGYLTVFLGFGFVFTVSMKVMGRNIKQFIPGYVIIFVSSLAIFVLASSGWAKKADLGAPLLALIIGLVFGNVIRMPAWFSTSLRTEYYIKTGIVLLGATLPLTLIVEAGPIAFLQATIVSVATWVTIYMAATKIFGLDPRFGAVLGAGGAVCGVSGSIAIGGAVRAEKDHIAIGIGVVSVWAIVMILTLSFLCKVMVKPLPASAASAAPAAAAPATAAPQNPGQSGMAATMAAARAVPAAQKKTPASQTRRWYHISPGQAGAWIGTSEYADAAGFAVVAEIAKDHGDAPIQTFTLMKVIGRDIWIGIWAFILSIISVMFWEKKRQADGKGGPPHRLHLRVVWDRFPKFVLGFFVASIVMTGIASAVPSDHVGKAKLQGTYKSKAEKLKYNANFDTYPWNRLPAGLQKKVRLDKTRRLLTAHGKISLKELRTLQGFAQTPDQRAAFKKLRYKSDWFLSELKKKAINPIKKLRSWAFVFCFLCIGLSTRFRDLLVFGFKPFWAFTIGVAINVPLGYFLTTVAFSTFWQAIG